MQYVIWIITSTTRGRTNPPDHPPMVYTDFEEAKRAYQHMCASNVSVEPNIPHRHEHWKTKTITRWTPAVFTDPTPLTQPEPTRTGLVATREDEDVVSWDRPPHPRISDAEAHGLWGGCDGSDHYADR